jgi:RimJ/RimL family protein N-acetyltransferase
MSKDLGIVPVLETARLRLRAVRADDLDACAAMLADPHIVRFTGGQTATREESWRKLLGATGMWMLAGYGYWTVERRETGACIGYVGFADFKRDMEPSIEGIPEMGWMFASHAHGQGYASEAIAAGLVWADEVLGKQDIVAIINADNAPSIHVAEKAGFSERQEALYRGEPILLFRRPARG